MIDFANTNGDPDENGGGQGGKLEGRRDDGFTERGRKLLERRALRQGWSLTPEQRAEMLDIQAKDAVNGTTAKDRARAFKCCLAADAEADAREHGRKTPAGVLDGPTNIIAGTVNFGDPDAGRKAILEAIDCEPGDATGDDNTDT